MNTPAGRIIDVNAHSRAAISGTALWQMIYGHTGRKVTGDEAYAFAREWATQTTREDLLSHDGAKEFRQMLSDVACVVDDFLLLSRGRCVDGVPPTSQQMGPPPLGQETSGGRYDKPYHPVLYLSSSEDGVRREFEQWNIHGTPYIQRYRLPMGKLRIADFIGGPPDHFATALFAIAETHKVEGRGGRDSYVFSQTVAELVAEQFDGIGTTQSST